MQSDKKNVCGVMQDWGGDILGVTCDYLTVGRYAVTYWTSQLAEIAVYGVCGVCGVPYSLVTDRV